VSASVGVLTWERNGPYLFSQDNRSEPKHSRVVRCVKDGKAEDARQLWIGSFCRLQH